jgi:hypothetical protein
MSWTSNGNSCVASSTPGISTWSGLKNSTGFEYINVDSFNGAIGAIIYGPNGEVIEKGTAAEAQTGYVNTVAFTKPGGDYPDGSYVEIGDGRRCQIVETSSRVTTCIPINVSEVKLDLTCRPSATSATSTAKTSSVRVGFGGNALTAASSTAKSKFVWEPRYDKNLNNLVVSYGDPILEPEIEEPPVFVNFSGIVTQAGTCQNENGRPNPNKYIQVVVKPCGSQPVSTGITSLGQLGTFFLWPGKGIPTPNVGDVVLGIAHKDHNTKCEDTTGPGAFPSGATAVGHIVTMSAGADPYGQCNLDGISIPPGAGSSADFDKYKYNSGNAPAGYKWCQSGRGHAAQWIKESESCRSNNNEF